MIISSYSGKLKIVSIFHILHLTQVNMTSYLKHLETYSGQLSAGIKHNNAVNKERSALSWITAFQI